MITSPLTLLRRWWRNYFPPVISTEWGPVDEGARRAAAANLRDDPAKLSQVIEMIGEKEARRRYPEAWE